MFTDKLPEQAHTMTDQAAQSAQMAIQSTQHAANSAVDGIADASRRIRATAMHASDTTVQYIRSDPVKSVLIAATVGAAITALIAVIARPRTRS